MWQWEQAGGRLTHDGEVIGFGYAGHLQGVNNPAMQMIPFVGPLPVGDYFLGPMIDHPMLGPDTIILTPSPNNMMYGRDAFRIHGDSVANYGQKMASDGCIILSRDIREQIWDSGDRDLSVISGLNGG